jgi:transposase
MKPTYEELFSQNQILIQQLNEALAEIQLLKAEIKELKDKLNTNSSNSSQPPSQDPFRTRKKKKTTGRKQGAQNGHQGHSRRLIPIEEVQIQHDLKPNVCTYCRSDSFDPKVVSTEVRQVLELPETPPEVTQYNIHTCRCNWCGKHVKASIPLEAQYGFGPRLMGFVTSLTGEFRLSKRQVVALVGKIGIRICSGSVCKIHERASEILKRPYEEIKEYTLKKKHLNADESSWKTLGKKRWIWIGHGEDSVFFKSKHHEAVKHFVRFLEYIKAA